SDFAEASQRFTREADAYKRAIASLEDLSVEQTHLDKLREYYSEFGHEQVIISLPKGAYVPSFERNPAARAIVAFPDAEQPEPVTARRRNWTLISVGAALVAIACGTAFWLVLPKHQRPPVRLAPLVSYPYDEGPPSLSPDGTMVAFACAPPGGAGPPD